MTTIPMPAIGHLPEVSSRDEKPIRVLHVLEATLGGTLRYLENIAAASEGLNVISALAYGSARADSRLIPLLERSRTHGWSTYPIDMRREIGPRYDFPAFVELQRVISSFRPDILHCHSSKAGALGRAAASLKFRSPIRLYTPNALAVPLGTKYLRIEKILARYTDGFIAVSESERAEIVDWSLAERSWIDVVYPSIDSEHFKPISQSSARLSLGIASGPLVLGVGRLTAQKDPGSFLEIIHRLRARIPSINAIWLGSGDGEEEFRAKVARAGLDGVVRVVPWQHDIRKYLAAANVLLSTSIFESFGYMVAEALSMEIPVVATDITGTCDIMRGPLREWLYPVKDYERAVCRLADLLQDTDRALMVGSLGRSEVKRRFTAELMRAALLRSYVKALETSSHRRNHEEPV